jgi:hypothetical protein
MRKLLIEKGTIAIFVLIAFAEALLNKGALVKVLPPFTSWVLLVGVASFIWTLFYAGFGQLMWFAARRNIPLIYSGFLFCVGASFLMFVLFLFLLVNIHPVGFIVTECLVLLVMMTIGMVVILIVHQDTIVTEFNTAEVNFPLWKRTQRKQPTLSDDAPNALRGQISYIQTSSQYIEINSTTGMQELRMSLTKAMTFLDHVPGTRVHRSYWVRNSEMKALTYKNGNPFVVLNGGQCIPIGRNMIAEIKIIVADKNDTQASCATL